MKKLPLKIIGVSLLFLGLGGIVKQVEKYFTKGERKFEFIAVNKRIPALPEIQAEGRSFLIVRKDREEFFDEKIKINPPLPPDLPTTNDLKEFTLEGDADNRSFKITEKPDETPDERDFTIYQKQTGGSEDSAKSNVNKMRIIIRKDKKPE